MTGLYTPATGLMSKCKCVLLLCTLRLPRNGGLESRHDSPSPEVESENMDQE